MMKWPNLVAVLLWCCMALGQPAFAAPASHTATLEHSTVTLMADKQTLKTGEPLLAGVFIELQPGWHTYTYNPGDSGIASSIRWTLPEGFSASGIYWPPHETFNEAGLTTYGFSHNFLLTQIISTAETLPPESVLQAKVDFLICKEICVPQTAELEITLATGDGAPSADALLLQSWKSKSQLAPEDGKIPQSNRSPSESKESHLPLLTAIFFALIGGLILNLMPCVFPVLSLKALAIAKHAELDHRTIRKEGIAYTLGILCCFWALAIILILLQQAGTLAGWGFQFQSPAFVGLMALLFLFIGLNLSGIFELPVLFGSVGVDLEKADSLRGSFLTGLLAALVATPCTAPFMATAIGAALSQPPLFSLSVFSALGLGLALPFLLISFLPRLLSYLPKPGSWMLTFRNFLAFPMYLSAVWLLWVVGTQTGIEGMTGVLATGIIILFLLWAKRPCQFKTTFCMASLFVVIIALLATMGEGLNRLQTMHVNHTNPAYASYGEPYTPARLAELRETRTPVFIDATASWCITCQINKKLAIQTDDVQEHFKKHGVVTLIADWTNKDDDVTHLLESFGYKGVPLYIYYAPHAEGKVLPQILTPSILIETIGASRITPSPYQGEGRGGG